MDATWRLVAWGLVALAPLRADAQAADVAAIQAREARNADARTIAALERFRQALVARYGSDPKLVMLDISETEGEALVVRGAGNEYVIRQGDRWMPTEARELKPWASASVAAANAFPLSSVKASGVRAWLDRWRKVPAQSTDFVTNYTWGYDPKASRVVVKATVGSMSTGRLTVQTFEPE